jgi:hypothetical protein
MPASFALAGTCGGGRASSPLSASPGGPFSNRTAQDNETGVASIQAPRRPACPARRLAAFTADAGGILLSIAHAQQDPRSLRSATA